METIQKSTELPAYDKKPEIPINKQIEILSVQMYHTFLHGATKQNIENTVERYIDLIIITPIMLSKFARKMAIGN